MADIVVDELPDWHIECKGTKSAVLQRSTLSKWWDQIAKDCPVGKKAVVLNKANNTNIIALLPYSVWRPISLDFAYEVRCLVNDSVSPASELNSMTLKSAMEIATGLRPLTEQDGFSVIYYAVNKESIYAIMDGEDFLKCIEAKKSQLQ